MSCLEADRYLWQRNISMLQAVLILIYGIHHSHGQTWSLLGLVYHLALSIGCHVDPATFRLDIVEAEERRRAWLALTILLCNQNLTMTGFDIYPSVFSSRILPPAEVYDESIVCGQPVPIERSPGSTPVSYLVWKSHIFRISSEISNPIHVTQQGNSPALHRLDGAVKMELNCLEQSYASMIELNLSVVHTNLLLSFTHHLVLLLHSAALSDLNSNLPQHQWSKQRCFESAQRVLELHADFHRLLQFTPFQWYIRGRGSFHAFHAAFLLVLIVSTHPEEPCFLSILRLLHECHARLEASRPQSQLCTRTANKSLFQWDLSPPFKADEMQ
ncbi:Transcription factorfungi [Penicillium lividum]|nr:Transcription factorfungi [Penicillium lividum]